MNKILLILLVAFSFSCNAQFPGLNRNYGSGAWDISGAVINQSKDISGNVTGSGGLYISTDGTKLYTIDADSIFQFAMSVAWDVSTITFTQKHDLSVGVGSQRALYFEDDGTKFFIVGTIGDTVDEWAMSTAWDVSTATYTRNTFVGTYQASPTGLPFKSDGTKFYVGGVTDGTVDEFDVTVGWDLTNVAYNQTIDVKSDIGNEGILCMISGDNGNYFYFGTGGSSIYSFTASTAWDISTLTTWTSFETGSAQSKAIFFNLDGTKFYRLSVDVLYEYDL